MKMLGDRVAVKLIDEKEGVSAGGVIIPESVERRNEPAKGEVIYVGEGAYDHGVFLNMDVAPGDLVYVEPDQFKQSCQIQDPEHGELLIVRNGQIVAIAVQWAKTTAAALQAEGYEPPDFDDEDAHVGVDLGDE